MLCWEGESKNVFLFVYCSCCIFLFVEMFKLDCEWNNKLYVYNFLFYLVVGNFGFFYCVMCFCNVGLYYGYGFIVYFILF